MEFDLLGILDRYTGMLILSSGNKSESHYQRFNVNMICLTYDSFCKGNECHFMWSYHYVDKNW